MRLFSFRHSRLNLSKYPSARTYVGFLRHVKIVFHFENFRTEANFPKCTFDNVLDDASAIIPRVHLLDLHCIYYTCSSRISPFRVGLLPDIYMHTYAFICMHIIYNSVGIDRVLMYVGLTRRIV